MKNRVNKNLPKVTLVDMKEEIRNKVAETAKQLKDDKVTVNSALGMEEAKLKEIINSAK